MNLKEKKIVTISIAFALIFGVTPVANAMHIMEGYLPPKFCIIWGVICVPFLVAGYLSLKKTLTGNRRSITIIAMAGAFIFVLSSLKIPSVTGSCSHMTGTGLGAILFGPSAVGILLAHGGLTTLGANTFSMAIAGPILSYAIYKLCQKLKVDKYVGIFLAASIGDLFTYCVISFELALAYPSQSGGVAASALKFLAVFAPTQLPLAIIEGILTVVIIMGLEIYAKSELTDLGFLKGGEK